MSCMAFYECEYPFNNIRIACERRRRQQPQQQREQTMPTPLYNSCMRSDDLRWRTSAVMRLLQGCAYVPRGGLTKRLFGLHRVRWRRRRRRWQPAMTTGLVTRNVHRGDQHDTISFAAASATTATAVDVTHGTHKHTHTHKERTHSPIQSRTLSLRTRIGNITTDPGARGGGGVFVSREIPQKPRGQRVRPTMMSVCAAAVRGGKW